MDYQAMPVEEVRSLIARTVLGNVPGDCRIGGVTLYPHQADALHRLRALMSRCGGALLADATGLGKTYVALSLLGEVRAGAVVAPAALRPTWMAALREAGCDSLFVSAESLSRSEAPLVPFDLVVVDEAHHFRNHRTRRYRRLAGMTRRARVLLLTATPVHNRRRDLESMLALFLGSQARALEDGELSACIIRREAIDVAVTQGRIPGIVEHAPFVLQGGDTIAERILALPPAVPAADEGDAAALASMLLHRLWCSSDAALRAAIRRRRARAIALREALEQGTVPTRAELAMWSYGDGALQLAFPELLGCGSSQDTTAVCESLARHDAALAELMSAIPPCSPRDAERARLIRAIRSRHAGARIVAFASFTATIAELWRQLANDRGVCALTSRGARVAGGELTRAEALARFAPRAHGLGEPIAAERIELLLSTDLLSEGVNLQDAAVVVQLDLPWTPARIEQRIGRAARLGSAHEEVHVYAMHPPPLAERPLALFRRLSEKLSAAGHIVGRHAPAEEAEEIRRVLRSWVTVPAVVLNGVAVAAVRGPRRGIALLWRCGDRAELTASLAEVRWASGRGVPVTACHLALVERCAARIAAERAQQALLSVADRPGAATSKAVLARIECHARAAAAHARPALLPLASRARRAVVAARGAGQEQALAELLRDGGQPAAWLRSVIEVAGSPSEEPAHDFRLVAAIVIDE